MATPSKPSDIELGVLRDGYPALAAWVARDPDGEALVFRKFNRLGARRLLHLQSELIALEHEIDELDEKAKRSDDIEEQQSSRRHETLMSLAKDDERPEKKRVEKLNELDELLTKYHKTLVLQAQIAEFKGPSSRVLSAYSEYMNGDAFQQDGMPPMPLISGKAKEFLSEHSDLIALRRSAEEDVLSKFIQNLWRSRKRKSSDPLDRTTIYKNRHVVQTVATLSMIIAAALLISAILSLHVVASDKAKLGLVAMYTIIFALSVALFTNARRAEVFATTAAYAAVLVVFVSGDLGGSKGDQCLIQLGNGYFKTVACPN